MDDINRAGFIPRPLPRRRRPFGQGLEPMPIHLDLLSFDSLLAVVRARVLCGYYDGEGFVAATQSEAAASLKTTVVWC